jgi:protein TonB
VPTAAVGWGLSLAAHGALTATALLAVRGMNSATRPPIRLQLGDGGQDRFGIYREGGPTLPPEAGFPPAAPADDRSAIAIDGERTALTDAAKDEAAPAAAAPFGALPLDDSPGSTATAVIGVGPAAAAAVPPVPSRRQMPGLAGAGSRSFVSGDAPAEHRGNIADDRRLGAGWVVSGDARAGGQDVGGAGTARGLGSPGTRGVPNGVADDARLPAPIYPTESRRRGEQGRVVLEVLVRADGSVGDVRVLADAGYPRLARAAVEAVRDAHLPPAREAGAPVAAWVRVPFDVVLR